MGLFWRAWGTLDGVEVISGTSHRLASDPPPCEEDSGRRVCSLGS